MAAASTQGVRSLAGDFAPALCSVGGVAHPVQQFPERSKIGIAAGRGKFAVEGNPCETADFKPFLLGRLCRRQSRDFLKPDDRIIQEFVDRVRVLGRARERHVSVRLHEVQRALLLAGFADTVSGCRVRNDPRDVAAILGLSRATCAKIVQNLIWATAHNTVAILMVASITVGTGFTMTPAVGAALMSASTVIVTINAQLLRFYRKKG